MIFIWDLGWRLCDVIPSKSGSMESHDRNFNRTFSTKIFNTPQSTGAAFHHIDRVTSQPLVSLISWFGMDLMECQIRNINWSHTNKYVNSYICVVYIFPTCVYVWDVWCVCLWHVICYKQELWLYIGGWLSCGRCHRLMSCHLFYVQSSYNIANKMFNIYVVR